jgi:hypothetical protein
MRNINYDETMGVWDDATGTVVQGLKWRFRPGQQLWWWDPLELRLHPCTMIRADYGQAWTGGKWIIDYDGPRPIQVNGNDLYTAREEAVAVAVAALDASLENSRVQQRKLATALERAKILLEE